MAYEGQPASAFVDMDIVQQHINAASDYLAKTWAEKYSRACNGLLRHYASLRFDSPLEVLFWTWWEAVCAADDSLNDIVQLQPQAEVTVGQKLFRVDFVVQAIQPEIALAPEWVSIAVEVDGHGFHERTREQVMYRDQRDRALQSAGWRVFHFSFGEFTARPVDSVTEVMLFARKQWNIASLANYKREGH